MTGARGFEQSAIGPRTRIVVAKAGLDGHDRGAKVVARALRDAGAEVIYTGLHQSAEQVVATVIQEDAEGVGLSVLSGAHMTLFLRILELLAEVGADDVVVFGGGIIPPEDVDELLAAGVRRVFGPGTPIGEIVEWVGTTFDSAARTVSSTTRQLDDVVGSCRMASGRR